MFLLDDLITRKLDKASLGQELVKDGDQRPHIVNVSGVVLLRVGLFNLEKLNLSVINELLELL